eukprot:3042120-Rhodomonas_salina.2
MFGFASGSCALTSSTPRPTRSIPAPLDPQATIPDTLTAYRPHRHSASRRSVFLNAGATLRALKGL